MKIRRLGLMVLPLLLSTSTRAQQVSQDSNPHHYKVIDLGLSKGGNSYAQGVFLPFFPGTKTLNSFGVVAAWADTLTPDPFSPNCYVDCFVGYALKWQGGSATNLGAVPQYPAVGPQEPCFDCAWSSSSFPLAISDSGLIAGESEDNATDPLTQAPVSLAVLWENGKIINLGTLGGNESGATGVNTWGVVDR